MLSQGRKYTTLAIPHRIIFHMEEFGLTELEARHKLHWRSWDYDRQVIRLYEMRRRMRLKHERDRLKEFGGIVW